MSWNPPQPESGETLHRWARDLFPLCRSLSGEGTRQTLDYIGELLPGLERHRIASGEKVFDWTVPDEWNIRDAWIEGPDGRRIVDFRASNLHVVGYSEPVDRSLDLDELEGHLYSLPEQPELIPYITSYYRRGWGFCLAHRRRQALEPGTYRVRIDSTLAPGHLDYADLVLPGDSDREVLFSTYVCHPSMANNELSGPVVTTALARWIASMPRRRYSYRFVFIPETIGSIIYLSRNLEHLRRQLDAGFVVTCVGDEGGYSYLESRRGGTLADRIAQRALGAVDGDYRRYSFLERGSDERQYGSPGVDLPVALMMRSKFGEYPEYHTSGDDLTLVTPRGLAGGLAMHTEAVRLLETRETYRVTVHGEPQLGKRGLYPTTSTRDSGRAVRDLMNVIAYCDGEHDLADLAHRTGLPPAQVMDLLEPLLENGLVTTATGPPPEAGE